ncbi:acyl-[acyl-carrier-protein]--UDP-N-acetylglucosamine O-acyltransferase [Aquibium oceanicum]|uniref:Acyl-[acyl-carrier-protein]--UDP-N-acetylglucosamine O-acyltransferase n=1 Tax=Aquibium oceanicum TaxID=1670800 RepID=A0A1L3SSV9_9HYPH|nr:acyl-[acyl-carrier-protein]--UDP-N-acetylglucosamine O-acyltransferase [Aquibium oceanicum]
MAETFIHPAAVVEDGAQIGKGAQIGPFCHIGPHAVIGGNVELMSHVSVMNATRIGDGTKVYPNVTLGGPPQDTKHKGSVTRLEIGRNCKIRENVTMHVGSDASSGVTMVGDDGFFLANSHVAHDCVVGNNVTLTHGATLGGHCEIGDHAIVGGLTGVHQFVRVGRRAFLGGSSAVMGDVIPYGMVVGNRAKLHGFNLVGMRRSGMARAEIYRMREAYRRIFDPARPVAVNLESVAVEFADTPSVMEIVAFMTNRRKRYYCVPPYLKAEDSGDDPIG